MIRILVYLAGLTAVSVFGATPPSSNTPRPVPAIEEALKRVDANQDGKLDPQEIARFIERSRSLSGAYDYAGRDFRLTGVKGNVVKEVLS